MVRTIGFAMNVFATVLALCALVHLIVALLDPERFDG